MIGCKRAYFTIGIVANNNATELPSAKELPVEIVVRPREKVSLSHVPEQAADSPPPDRDLPGPGLRTCPKPLAERCWLEEREWQAAFSLQSGLGQDPHEREARR